jgi:hypothetical protein
VGPDVTFNGDRDGFIAKVSGTTSSAECGPTPTPTATSTPTATATSTPTPTPTATATPTATPGASTPGKVTGGGQVDPITGQATELASMTIVNGSPSAGVGGKANFGFVVQFRAGDPAPTGNLNYIDQTANVRINSVAYSLLVITGTHAFFTGTATVNSNGVSSAQQFRVDVDDLGEPGTAGPDTFSIVTSGGYAAAGPLTAGNIQIQR